MLHGGVLQGGEEPQLDHPEPGTFQAHEDQPAAHRSVRGPGVKLVVAAGSPGHVLLLAREPPGGAAPLVGPLGGQADQQVLMMVSGRLDDGEDPKIAISDVEGAHGALGENVPSQSLFTGCDRALGSGAHPGGGGVEGGHAAHLTPRAGAKLIAGWRVVLAELGVGQHGQKRPVHELDLRPRSGLRRSWDGLGRKFKNLLHSRFGQPLACLAVGGRAGGAQAAAGPLSGPGQGIGTPAEGIHHRRGQRGVGVESLEDQIPEGDQRGEDPLIGSPWARGDLRRERCVGKPVPQAALECGGRRAFHGTGEPLRASAG